MKTNVLIGIMKDTGATCVPAMPLLIEKIYKGILANVKAKGPLVGLVFRFSPASARSSSRCCTSASASSSSAAWRVSSASRS